MAHIPQLETVWLLFGTGNHQRYVNIAAVYKALESILGFLSVLGIYRLWFQPSVLSNWEKEAVEDFSGELILPERFCFVQKTANENYKSSYQTIKQL